MCRIDQLEWEIEQSERKFSGGGEYSTEQFSTVAQYGVVEYSAAQYSVSRPRLDKRLSLQRSLSPSSSSSSSNTPSRTIAEVTTYQTTCSTLPIFPDLQVDFTAELGPGGWEAGQVVRQGAAQGAVQGAGQGEGQVQGRTILVESASESELSGTGPPSRLSSLPGSPAIIKAVK